MNWAFFRNVHCTVDREPALRSAGTLLSRVRAPLPVPWTVRGPDSLRSSYCRRSLSSQVGVGGIVLSESALGSEGTLLSRVQAPLPAPWSDGGPKSLRSPCCGLAMYKNETSLRSPCQNDKLLQIISGFKTHFKGVGGGIEFKSITACRWTKCDFVDKIRPQQRDLGVSDSSAQGIGGRCELIPTIRRDPVDLRAGS
ncbi:hypothetical protein PoB_007270000 [Plakobranchus ocellatus]|uniref:Uncharacterized protein n=1 Tax=Plakobranchus ocellatus TaxID=259542 RepID=A0AAV4DPX3_9GAST|nr:hypothetical protein PoB_007270000 [Plakobranchus ocellatus]